MTKRLIRSTHLTRTAMTSKLGQQTKEAGNLAEFPEFPPRDDMQNSLHLDDPAHQAALKRHFGNNDTTIVLSEIPVRQIPSQQEGHRVPDLLIAFGVNRTLAVEQKGYSIRDQGKPPDFVLEIASESTGEEDYTVKRRDYAAFGIPEYWRFDPSGGRHHTSPLAGDRLVEQTYQPVDTLILGQSHLHGHSTVLNLDLCWQNGQLRWFDPAANQYLLTHDQAVETLETERQARIAAEERVRQLESELTTRRES